MIAIHQKTNKEQTTYNDEGYANELASSHELIQLQAQTRQFEPKTSILVNNTPFIQPKLKIGAPNDQYEQEADRMADFVVRNMNNPTLQTKPKKKKATPLVQRKSSSSRQNLTAPHGIAQKLQQRKGQGAPLTPQLQAKMEQGFGVDFSKVRVHTDSDSVQMNKQLGARAFTHGSDVYFNRGEFQPSSTEGQRLLAHELTHVVQQEQHSNLLQKEEAPQSFQEAKPGSIALNSALVERNKTIEKSLLSSANKYYAAEDLRWFFSYAHGKITQQINKNISLFQRPNALMRLNIHFAEEFIRALDGQPHRLWKRAFKACSALQKTGQETMFLIGEVEACGARMAHVHINIDLRNALRDVGCIPPADYGNMLVLVNRGSLAALVKLRGRLVGATEAILQHLAAPLSDLEVKTWRNSVYQKVCNNEVPQVEDKFTSKIK